MSCSMCCAESLKPMGMPPVASRASPAKARKSAGVVQSGKRAGETADFPSASPRTCAILPFTFSPGRCPPVPVLAACPPLKCMACTFWSLSIENPNRAEASSYR